MFVEFYIVDRKSFPCWLLMTSENEVLEVLSFLVRIEVSNPHLAADSADGVAGARELETRDRPVLKFDPVLLLFGSNVALLPPIKRFYHAASFHLFAFGAHDHSAAYAVEAVDRAAEVKRDAGPTRGLPRIPKSDRIVPRSRHAAVQILLPFQAPDRLLVLAENFRLLSLEIPHPQKARTIARDTHRSILET